jgi:hypothetical protein
MKNLLLILSLVFVSCASEANDMDSFFKKSDVFFKKYVANSKVDYAAVKSNSSDLEALLNLTENANLNGLTDNETKAFWINAYNLHVIKGVVAKYPVKSPLDVPGFFDKIQYTVAGNKITLNDIENKKIREKYNDARIHFVLVCGANSCPPIIEGAYFPETLEKQLNEQTKLALNNPNFIKVSKGKVSVSQIFEWYKKDFITKKSNEIDFINKFRTTKISSNSKLGYYTYDWTLNKK